MTNRMRRRSTAKQTVEILERGYYICDTGETVNIVEALERSITGTRHYAPEDLNEVCSSRDRILSSIDEPHSTTFRVTNTTTLAAAHTLINADPSNPVLCLNFASAKNPGGGFLGGSQAQEESLARATGLYATINGVRDYYETNRNCGTCLYTDHMIYSPDVPVFRDDHDIFLTKLYPLSIITSPAVNAGALANANPEELDQIAPTMRRRIESVLALSTVQGHRTLILGAWGCGVFRNDPNKVATWFYELLCGRSDLVNSFDLVVFAVLDKTKDLKIIRPFEERFGHLNKRG